MSVKNKMMFVAVAAPILIVSLVIAIVAVNFRDNGIENAKQKSLLTAEFVRDALTAHMVNGVMDKRNYFLDKIEHSQNIRSLWIVRGESVDNQFGKSNLNEEARDETDKRVLKTAKPEYIFSEDSRDATLRVTIPYVATSTGTPNCLQCHDAKEGQVLGAVSMVFDVNDIRTSGMMTIGRVLVISAVLLLFSVILVHILISPYLNFFNSLKSAIKRAEDGDFTYRIHTSLKDEAGDIAKWLNSLYDNLQKTIKTIERQVTFLFSANEHDYSSHPLYKTREIINELVDIYKFKRTIELDASKNDIYKRLIHIISDRLNIANFSLFETDQDGKKQSAVYVVQNNEIVAENQKVIKSLDCRAYRTNSEVCSDDFYKVCGRCVLESSDENYLCFPYAISATTGILISLHPTSNDDIPRLKTNLHILKNYLDAAKPVIESKILTDMLKESSLRDAMTGLYNRRFLEEYFEKVSMQANRLNASYSILMIDIDYFKMVNDTYGHDIGDVIIRGLAQVLKESIRTSDMAIRFGGEEFLIALFNPTEEGAIAVAEKIRKSFESNIFDINGEKLQKTISIGVSFFPHDADDIWKAIKFADIALYAAKHSGRNKVMRFMPEMQNGQESY